MDERESGYLTDRIRKLEQMNRVHGGHDPESYRRLQHLVFALHDSAFECVCDGLDVTTAQGSIYDVIPAMVKLLSRSGSRSYRNQGGCATLSNLN